MLLAYCNVSHLCENSPGVFFCFVWRTLEEWAGCACSFVFVVVVVVVLLEESVFLCFFNASLIWLIC